MPNWEEVRSIVVKTGEEEEHSSELLESFELTDTDRAPKTDWLEAVESRDASSVAMSLSVAEATSRAPVRDPS